MVPVGFRYNPEQDTIDIGGHNIVLTKKYRDALRHGRGAQYHRRGRAGHRSQEGPASDPTPLDHAPPFRTAAALQSVYMTLKATWSAWVLPVFHCVMARNHSSPSA